MIEKRDIKKVLLTFDYELFLGTKSGTVQNCLLKPTFRLLEIMERYHAKAIFFIDTTYLHRLDEVSENYPAAKADMEAIKFQLDILIKKGHLLFHHIHPHWLDAIYLPEINQWDLTEKSRFTCDKLNEREKEDIFKYSDTFLKECYVRAGSAKQPVGYRAGGLYIEPFSSVKEVFLRYGISYDFSVIPGFSKTESYPFFDYTNCPSEQIYKFENSPVTESTNGSFIEFAISHYELTGFRKILNGIDYRFNKKNALPYGDGQSVNQPGNQQQPKRKIGGYFRAKNSMSIELMNKFTLNKSLVQTRKMAFVQFISHPKLISEKNLYYFEKYLSEAVEKYRIETDLSQMSGLWD